MPVNRVSTQLGEAEQQAALAAIQTIRQKLPFLIDLTPALRGGTPGLGARKFTLLARGLSL